AVFGADYVRVLPLQLNAYFEGIPHTGIVVDNKDFHGTTSWRASGINAKASRTDSGGLATVDRSTRRLARRGCTCPSAELDGHWLACFRGRARKWRRRAVQPVVAAVFPGENEQPPHDGRDGFGPRRARQQEGQVHQQAAGGRQSGEGAQQQPDAYRQLAEDND